MCGPYKGRALSCWVRLLVFLCAGGGGGDGRARPPASRRRRRKPRGGRMERVSTPARLRRPPRLDAAEWFALLSPVPLLLILRAF